MKVIVRCLGCSKVTRFYGSYKVKILEDCKELISGQHSIQEFEGRICKNCAAHAGYKFKGFEKEI